MTIRGVLGLLGGLLVSWAIALSLWFLMMTLTARPAHGQAWPDSARLGGLADTAGVPPAAVLALAWEESGTNLDPRLRGHRCWYQVRARTDTTVTVEARRMIWSTYSDTITRITRRAGVTHHERDCEVGRFQIKPSTARQRCPAIAVSTYAGNLACFAQMFA